MRAHPVVPLAAVADLARRMRRKNIKRTPGFCSGSFCIQVRATAGAVVGYLPYY